VISPAAVLVHNKPMMSPQCWARDYANQVLKYFKEGGVGTGARNGQHGVPFGRAATVLQKAAKSGRVPTTAGGQIELLDEIREELLNLAKRFRARARGFNHPGG